jgi:4-hydroxybenzoate polyprenyltransferase
MREVLHTRFNPMKTYKTILRAILMLTTISLLLIGALFSYQHWEGGKNLLWIGLLLFIVMVGDHYISKKAIVKENTNSENND